MGMTTTDRRDFSIRFDPSLAVGLFLAAALLATSFVPPYGWFIDELYYLSCSRRLAFGYVDMPPLSIALLAAERALLGEGLLAARLLPALSMGATAWLAGRTARRYGGGTTGELLAALSVAAMPAVLVFGSFYSMNAYEPLVVLGLFALALRLVEEEDARVWLPMGLVLGVGLELKHTMILFAVAIVAGLLVAGPRRLLFSWWTLGGILACLVLVLPNLAWQIAHGFPSLEHYRNSFLQKNIAKSPFEVLLDQILFVGPASLPLWLGGLVWLATPGGRRFRFVAVAYLLLLMLVVMGRSSRPDRITSMYPVLLSLGSAAAGRLSRRPWPAVARGYTVVVVAGGLVLAPIMCPVLGPAPLREYMSALGVQFRIEAGKRDEVVPQWLGDRIGWRELAGEVARVVRALPDEERGGAVLVSTDYGAAGAMEAYGPGLGLPPVFATHNAFHSWGPPPDSASVYVGVQVDEDSVRRQFESVEVAATAHCPDCTRPQKSIRILLLRGPRFSFAREWPGFHRYH
jgi:4-amino-4-deoxy-L-arabinose transferase-like glycosyltransferase